MQEKNYDPVAKAAENAASIAAKNFVSQGIPVRQIRVLTEEASKSLNRACGLYTTIQTGPMDRLVDGEPVCACLSEQLKIYLSPFLGKRLCICGIGNRELSSDSLGPKTTQLISPQLYEALPLRCNFEKIAVVCPSVSGITNLNTETTIAAIVSAMKADCILTIDACACDDIEDLCGNIQLTDTGMRSSQRVSGLQETTVGVPVVSIGVPTAIQASMLSADNHAIPDRLVLTPTHIEEAIKAGAFIISCAILQTAYPELDYEACKNYIGMSLYGVL